MFTRVYGVSILKYQGYTTKNRGLDKLKYDGIVGGKWLIPQKNRRRIDKMARTCKCARVGCNAIGTTATFTRVNSPSRNYKYYCPNCYDRLESYSTQNNMRKGKATMHGKTLGIELEGRRMVASHDLLMQGWRLTYDCTVPCEWKSPIYERLSGLSRLFTSIEKTGMHRCDGAGQHINVGRMAAANNSGGLGEKEILRLRKYLYTIVKDTQGLMIDNPDATVRLFGRHFVGYASKIEEYTSATEHCNWMNLQSLNRVEFRIAKFQTAKQYMQAVRWAWDAIDILTDAAIAIRKAKAADEQAIAEKAGAAFARLTAKYMGV